MACPSLARPIPAGRLRPVVALVVALPLASCGDDPTAAPTVAQVVVTPPEALVEIDGSLAFVAEARDGGGERIPGARVMWSTANTGVAAVSSTGEAFGRASGSTAVFATVDGVRGQAMLEVVAPVPEPPSDLRATTISDREIRLGWRDRSRYETSFEIQRFDLPTASFGQLAAVGLDELGYTDLSVVADGVYTYRVRACNATGCSEFTEEVTAGTPPTAPTELRVTVLAAGSLALTWLDVSETETEFVVERRPSGGSWAEAVRLAANRTSYTDEGLVPDTEYGYRVRACSAAGCSVPGAEVIRRTAPLPAPEAPSAVSAWLLAPLQVVLTWTDNSGRESSFEVERAKGTETFSLLATTDDNVAAYSDTGVEPDTRYRYRVRACNAGGCSAWSAESVVGTAPVAPTELAATAQGETAVELTWVDASRTETEFRIERKRETDAFVQTGIVNTGSASYTDTGLDRDTRYTYRIRACNEAGCSPASAEASVTTPVTTPPSAPSGLLAIVEVDLQIVLLWNDNSGIETGYEIERKVETGDYAPLATVGADTDRYTDEDLAFETHYSYRVRACGVAGCSAYSNSVSPRTPLASPSDVAATATSSSSIAVSWTDNSALETEIRIERGEGPDTFTTTAIFILGPDATHFVDTGLDPDTPYRYRVRACDPIGCSRVSPEATATTPP